MSKHKKQKGTSKKTTRRQNVRWLVYITSILVLLLSVLIWHNSSREDNDLSAIGNGENIIVQVHDPG